MNSGGLFGRCPQEALEEKCERKRKARSHQRYHTEKDTAEGSWGLMENSASLEQCCLHSLCGICAQAHFLNKFFISYGRLFDTFSLSVPTEIKLSHKIAIKIFNSCLLDSTPRKGV